MLKLIKYVMYYSDCKLLQRSTIQLLHTVSSHEVSNNAKADRVFNVWVYVSYYIGLPYNYYIQYQVMT